VQECHKILTNATEKPSILILWHSHFFQQDPYEFVLLSALSWKGVTSPCISTELSIRLEPQYLHVRIATVVDDVIEVNEDG
jgi:hypothetical protein